MRWIIALLSVVTSLAAIPPVPTSIVADPIGLVSGSVNVVSGTYQEVRCDLEVNCVEPIRLYRSHISSERRGFSFGVWRSDWEQIVMYQIPGYGWSNPRLHEPNGRVTVFKGQEFENMHPDLPEDELCNTFWGEIGGKTDVHNHHLSLKNFRFTLRKGDGEERIYTLREDLSRRPFSEYASYYFLLREVRLPNGRRQVYSYNAQHWLQRIETLNSAGDTLLGWLEFEYTVDGHYTIVTAIGSDGQRVERHCRKARFLDQVVYQDTLIETYDLEGRCGTHDAAILARKLPNHHELAIQYLHAGKTYPAFAGETIEFIGSNRVHAQLATTGSSPRPQPLYQFYYYLGKTVESNSDPRIGQTNVVNANGGIASFTYPSGRIEARTRYTADHLGRESIDCLQQFWGHLGRLSRVQKFKTSNTSCSPALDTHYLYDERGNVTCETVTGDSLSYTRRFAFSNDGFNLTTMETDGTVKKTYEYVPGTNLLAESCVYEQDSLVSRTTHEYDHCAVCIATTEEIYHQGSPVQIKTTYTTPRKDGLPEYIEERVNGHLIREVHLHYNERNWVSQKDIHDANGMHRYSTYTDYDDFGRVVMERDAEGNIQRFAYDENGNCISLVSPRNHETSYTYDYANNLLSETLDGLSIEYEYDAMGNCTLERDTCGNETHYYYDSHGRCIKEVGPAVATPNGSICPETHRVFDGLDRVVSETDPRGNTTSYTYNGRGQVLSITYPDGSKEQRSYYPDGRLKSETQKNGTKVKYIKDHLDRVLKTTTKSAEGKILRETSCAYEGPYKVSETDAEGNTTFYSYDERGQLAEETSDESRVTYHYDPLGRCVEQREYHDSTGYVATCWEYDLLDRIISEQIEVSLTTYGYDADGNQTQTTRYLDAHRTNTTTTEYNAHGQPTKETNALGHETQIEYDYRGVLTTTTTDAMDNRTIVMHDPAGNPHLIQKESTLGQLLAQQEVLRDLSGNIVEHKHTVVDQGIPIRTVRTTWDYDSCNRWITLTEGDGSPEARKTYREYNHWGQLTRTSKPSKIDLYRSYDAFGRLASYRGPDFSYVYAYDLNDHLIEIDSNGRKTFRTYDSMGRIVKETLENGAILQRTFDGIGRRTSLLLPDHSIVDYVYNGQYLNQVAFGNYVHTYSARDGSGNVLEEVRAGDVQVTYSYDDLERLRSIDTLGYSQFVEKYDQVGNILGLTNEGESVSYTYDDLYQLNSEPHHTYHHDSLFNRTGHNGESFDYNALNQNQTYTYSQDGYLLSDDGAAYVYDSLGRLIEVESKGYNLTFTYDPFNRRMSKTVTKHGVFGAETTRYDYLYDGNHEIGTTDLSELRILGEGRGAEIGASVLVLLNGTAYIPIHDHRGSVVMLLDTYHSPVEDCEYSAFGLSRPSISPWGFLSKRHDETGLIYFGQRYYVPESGTWLTPDPVGYEDGPNLYAYCLNNPLTMVDWWGLEAQDGFSAGFMQRFHQNMGLFNRLDAQFTYMITHPVALARDGWPQHLQPKPLLEIGGPNGVPEIMGRLQSNGRPLSSLYRGDAASISTAWGGVCADTVSGIVTAPLFRLGQSAPRLPNSIPMRPTPQSLAQTGTRQALASGPMKLGTKPNLKTKLPSTARNRLQPHPGAKGDHSVFKVDHGSGSVSKYATYRLQTNQRNPSNWELMKRYDSNISSHTHFNKVTKEWVRTPHVHDPSVTGGIRPPHEWEIP